MIKCKHTLAPAAIVLSNCAHHFYIIMSHCCHTLMSGHFPTSLDISTPCHDENQCGLPLILLSRIGEITEVQWQTQIKVVGLCGVHSWFILVIRQPPFGLCTEHINVCPFVITNAKILNIIADWRTTTTPGFQHLQFLPYYGEYISILFQKSCHWLKCTLRTTWTSYPFNEKFASVPVRL